MLAMKWSYHGGQEAYGTRWGRCEDMIRTRSKEGLKEMCQGSLAHTVFSLF